MTKWPSSPFSFSVLASVRWKGPPRFGDFPFDRPINRPFQRSQKRSRNPIKFRSLRASSSFSRPHKVTKFEFRAEISMASAIQSLNMVMVDLPMMRLPRSRAFGSQPNAKCRFPPLGIPDHLIHVKYLSNFFFENIAFFLGS